MANDSVDSGEYAMAAAELKALLDAAVDAIVMIDEQGCVTTFNSSAEKLFGRSAGDVVGEKVDILMPEPDRSRHAEYMHHYLATGEARIIGIGREVLACRANGETFPIALSVGEAVNADGRCFVGIIRDLSEQRAAEERTRSLDARLAHVGRFNLMGEMAAGIAHEINQPLAAIATYAQAAKRIMERDQPDLAVLADVCEKIDTQARRAGQVIENLRAFIRDREVATRHLDVNRVIDDVWNLIEADARAEGIGVLKLCAEGLPQVDADPVQLQQVLLNLTRNSVDAMRGSLDKGRGIVVTTGRANGTCVRIEVADHGHGVSRHLSDNIFHPFVTTKREGMGVGLAISRTIVQSYGGTLTFRDNPEGGSVFVVELPPREEEES